MQTDSTPRDDTISSEDEDSQYMHYQGNTKHKHSGDDDDDVDSSDHMDGHEEEAKDDKIDNDEVEMTKEQKKTDIAGEIDSFIFIYLSLLNSILMSKQTAYVS